MIKMPTLDFLQYVASSNNVYIVKFWFETDDDVQEYLKAAPFLNFKEDSQIFSNRGGYVICSTSKEAMDIFSRMVGTNGPAPKNSYQGNAKVNSFVVGPNGGITATVVDNRFPI